MKFYIVDVFAEEKYSGNQLAVFIQDQELSDKQMQDIANETHFSETTFIKPDKNKKGFDVRIFTPDIEVPFAGHPTLGTAFIANTILEDSSSSKIILNEGVGPIPIEVTDDFYQMTQNQPEFGNIYPKELFAKILSIDPEAISSDYPVQFVSTGLGAIVVPVKDIDILKEIKIDHRAYEAFLAENGPGNIIIFGKKDDSLIKCRVFVDDTGYGEDPATGSANGDLAAYILKYDYFGSQDLSYIVEQGAEAKRPSKLYIDCSYDGNTYDIKVGGKVFLIAEGEWFV